jgi:hypothetical protein
MAKEVDGAGDGDLLASEVIDACMESLRITIQDLGLAEEQVDQAIAQLHETVLNAHQLTPFQADLFRVPSNALRGVVAALVEEKVIEDSDAMRFRALDDHRRRVQMLDVWCANDERIRAAVLQSLFASRNSVTSIPLPVDVTLAAIQGAVAAVAGKPIEDLQGLESVDRVARPSHTTELGEGKWAVTYAMQTAARATLDGLRRLVRPIKAESCTFVVDANAGRVDVYGAAGAVVSQLRQFKLDMNRSGVAGDFEVCKVTEEEVTLLMARINGALLREIYETPNGEVTGAGIQAMSVNRNFKERDLRKAPAHNALPLDRDTHGSRFIFEFEGAEYCVNINLRHGRLHLPEGKADAKVVDYLLNNLTAIRVE